jgi:glycosyltransferase involved in cell wall biosynthesis
MMVSILLLAVDRLAFLQRCVESILAHTTQTDFEIVFVLQNSPPDIVAYVDSLQCKKVVHRYDYNAGITPGRNKAMELATGDFLLFFDDDAYVAERIEHEGRLHIPHDEHLDWLARLTKYFGDPSVGVVGQSGTYINLDTPGVFWECKGVGVECDVAQGYCFMFRRSMLADVGYLDPFFAKVWHEESEYALRAKFHGYKVVNSGYLGVFHLGSGSGDDGSYGQKLNYMWQKWCPHFDRILVPRAQWVN